MSKKSLFGENNQDFNTRGVIVHYHGVVRKNPEGSFRPADLNRTAYISANSTRYKARFKREGIMYGKIKEKGSC